MVSHIAADIAQISYRVEGEVQGVSFRYYTCKEAKKMGVTGWVQNASDGTVRLPALPALPGSFC